MRNLIFKGAAIVILLFLTSYSVPDDIVKTKNLIGTWEYNVPEAPQQYQNGEIIFLKKEGKLEGNLAIGNYMTPLRDLNSKKDRLTCEAYISGENISFDLTFKKNSFTGTASYSEGTLEIAGHKKMDE